jgi:Spy/CpxP family protein refolding chaperone
MKRVISWTVVAAMLALAPVAFAATASEVASRAASKPASKPAKEHKALQGVWAQLAKELALTDEQKTKIGDLLEARQAELAPITEKLKATRQAIKDAQAKNEKDKVAKLKAERAVLVTQETTVREKYEPQIMGAFTDKQKLQYDEHFVLMRVWIDFAAADLTVDQQDKIKAKLTEIKTKFKEAHKDAKEDKDKELDLSTRAERDKMVETLTTWAKSKEGPLAAKQKEALKAGATSQPAEAGGD